MYHHHIHFMHHALRLAGRGLGNTYPNPAVGAVVVKEGCVVGRGWTAPGGRPHAEIRALEQAGMAARNATLYVTLEPCAHHGKSPPCTDAILEAGITRVVAACTDPNPLVMGKGFACLRAGGIDVTEGVCRQAAESLNTGFFLGFQQKRPLVGVKLATSLDGKIATGTGESQWITGEKSRQYGHYLRATHDAILTGIGTVLADNPRLDCRLPGREHESPQRILLDSRLRTPPDARILPAWLFAVEGYAGARAESLVKKGAEIFTYSPVGVGERQVNLSSFLETLAGKGITRLLVEAGSLANAFITQGLADRIYWFRAPLVIGNAGIPACSGHDGLLADKARYRRIEVRTNGEDILEVYECSP